jgi:hypothetical protein
MYEHRQDPVITRIEYWIRVLRHTALAIGIMVALMIGVVGFKLTSTLTWIDSFVDASMLLGGMGPVNCASITTAAGKTFASIYALFCGIVFLAVMGIILAPLLHRFIHKFHAREHEPREPNI